MKPPCRGYWGALRLPVRPKLYAQPRIGGSRGQHLWRNPDDTWRWRWRGGGIELTSNEAYQSRDKAVTAARVAYAGVRIRQDDPPEGAVLPAPRHRPGWGTRLIAAAVWVVLFLLGRRRAD
jgi:ubiquinol-cytochrome c reductase cytochrome b subunit